MPDPHIEQAISGFKNKLEVNAANLMPDSIVVHNLYHQQQPVEQEQKNNRNIFIYL